MQQQEHPGQPSAAGRYVHPAGWFIRHLMNPVVAALARHGMGPYGAHVLAVRGRASGQWRRTPVNPLSLAGARYLVAARGHVQWTRNMLVAGGGTLSHGRSTERFVATEVADADKPAVLRAYLRRWRFEVGAFFDGVGPDSDTEDLLRVAPDHPVFRIQTPD
jgi:hypothetical protein